MLHSPSRSRVAFRVQEVNGIGELNLGDGFATFFARGFRNMEVQQEKSLQNRTAHV